MSGLYLLCPGSIFYATLLDATILTTFLVVCLFYLLWRIKGRDSHCVPVLEAVAVALFFTKSLFQMPVIPLIGLCVYLLKPPRRVSQTFPLITVGVGLHYRAKQFHMFHILSTSSFGGYISANRSGSTTITQFTWT